MSAYKEHYSGGEWRKCVADEGECRVHEGESNDAVPHIAADTKEELAVKREQATEQIMTDAGHGKIATLSKTEPKLSSWSTMDRNDFQEHVTRGMSGTVLLLRQEVRQDIQNATTEDEREEALWKADQADQAIERRVAIMDENPGDYYVREADDVEGTEFEKDPSEPDYSHLSTRALLHLSDHTVAKRDSPSTLEGAQRNGYVRDLEGIEEELRWRMR